jgi:ribonucleotide reductase alpha subunit
MGSPIVGGPKYTVTAARYARRGFDLDDIEARVAERERIPIEVPVTAIYSRRDGIVAWQACIDSTNPCVEHHQVSSTHTGLGFQAEVLAIVARALAAEQPAGR